MDDTFSFVFCAEVAGVLVREGEEARDIVDDWRLAAEKINDNGFRQLALITDERCDNYQRIQEYITAYQATPEDEYGKRADLCDKILQIDKTNSEFIQHKLDSLKGLYEKSGNLPYEKRLLICNEMLKYDPKNSKFKKEKKIR